MIAVVQLVLSSPLLLLADEPLEPLVYEEALATRSKPIKALVGAKDVRVLVLPPYRSRRPGDSVPGVNPQDPDWLNPSDPQPIAAEVTIDGKPAIQCDAIAVNIEAPGFDFERRRDDPIVMETIASLVELACDAVNGVLQRIRVLTRATHLRPLEPDAVLYRVAFLNDTGEIAEKDEAKFRQTWKASHRIQHVAITPAAWQSAVALGEYEAPAWDVLLLDAMDLDVELGPSLVLAATAVETRIANALDTLAKAQLAEDLWDWIKKRGGDYTKTPSVAEQLDALLNTLAGRSLKDNQRLWEAGVHLRDARNSFVHEGRARIGRKRKQDVTRAKARELVVQAGEIIEFIESALPEEERRPRMEHPVEVTTTLPIWPPGTASAEQSARADPEGHTNDGAHSRQQP